MNMPKQFFGSGDFLSSRYEIQSTGTKTERTESVSHHTARWLIARRIVNTSMVIASGRDTPAVEIFLYAPLQ
jgi:hypothetical protein